MPKPGKDETQDDYIGRCMADPKMVGEFPDESQRAAVCYSYWREGKSMRKTLPARLKAGNGIQFTATISTDSVDADGEVLIPQGMDATEFEKRPTVFWNHDYNRPIGKALGRIRRKDHEVESDVEFASRPDVHEGEWFPDTVKALIEQDVVKGVSVGFEPMESRPANAGDRAKFGDTVRRVHARWRLLEWSVAPLQCNPDALINAVRKGKITAEVAKSMFNVDVPAEPEPVVPPPEPQAEVETKERKPQRMALVVILEHDQPQDGPDLKLMVRKEFAKACGLLYI